MTATNWIHLRPRCQRDDLRPGLEARVHDPLWLLHRQWQTGEFRGEDAGSPIRVDLESESFTADRITIDGVSRPYDPQEAPLEAIVERETVAQVRPDLRTRAQTGLGFLRQIRLSGVAVDRAGLLARFGFSSDERADLAQAEAAVRLLAERAPDGEALRGAFPQGGSESEIGAVFPGLGATQTAKLRPAVKAWIKAYDARLGRPAEKDAWVEERMEYRFGLSVPTNQGRVELVAREYPGGRLDWDAFCIESLNTGQTSQGQMHNHWVLPGPVSFPGMPAPRLWEFEDAAVDFGDPETMEQDLGRLLLAECAMVWGNDWFQVPVEVPTGSLTRINHLLVTDTFGVTTRVLPQATHSNHWALNRLSRLPNEPSLDFNLFVPPVLPVSHQASPLESVLLLRDETANVAWAVETVLPDPLGRPRERAEGLRRGRRGLERLNGDARLSYRVMTDLPEQWLPLLPKLDSNHSYLVRAGLLDEIAELQAPEPQGEILSRQQQFRVHQEEIPRDGVEVSRAYQLARWYDGRRSLWVGRRKRAGVGELRSELEFDALIGEEAAD